MEEEKQTYAKANIVNRSLDADTQESIDSGFSKDSFNSDDAQSIESKQQKKKEASNADPEMRLQKSLHSSPRPSNVPVEVSFDENEQQLVDASENDDAVEIPDGDNVKRKEGEEIKKQDSLDESFIEIDVTTVDGALTAIVSEHLPSDTNRLTESMTDNNKTLVEEDLLTQSDVRHVEESNEEEGDLDSELQKSLDATSRKNVSVNLSMEMARENLIMIEHDDAASTNDSFYSARSDITITDDTDNTSSRFLTANDRLTPINDELSFSIPNLSTTSPYSSKAELSARKGPSPSPRPPKNNKKNGSTFEIQFIDETTHKVMSRESLLTASFDAKQVKKQKRMSAPVSPGKETSV